MAIIYNSLKGYLKASQTYLENDLNVAKAYCQNKLKENQETIDAFKKTAFKVSEFIRKNESLLFFFATIAFSYFMTPVATFAYLKKIGNSLDKIFLENFAIGSSLLIIGNVFNLTKISEDNDNRINYLSGILNICSIYLGPVDAITTSTALLGFIISKTFYRNIFTFPEEKKKVYAPKRWVDWINENRRST
ncbi:MAG: hypothetical protein K1060chlam5_01209 [Candidatus Anoxychlamydiales bacterium]|nr:hypothetical protein [Candidatus Anoxychlamydiales bacterium]